MTNKPGQEKIIEGVRYYINGSRQWIADKWDAAFLPAIKLDIKKKHYKGKNPNSFTELLNG